MIIGTNRYQPPVSEPARLRGSDRADDGETSSTLTNLLAQRRHRGDQRQVPADVLAELTEAGANAASTYADIAVPAAGRHDMNAAQVEAPENRHGRGDRGMDGGTRLSHVIGGGAAASSGPSSTKRDAMTPPSDLGANRAVGAQVGGGAGAIDLMLRAFHRDLDDIERDLRQQIGATPRS